MDDELLVFLNARLDEDEQLARDARGADWAMNVRLKRDLEWVLDQTWRDTEHIVRHSPARALRELEAIRATISRQVSDHAPVETMYGLCCRTCVDWRDAPLADGGETEFGIAIPHQWPCRVARSIAARWSDHPDYRPEWKL